MAETEPVTFICPECGTITEIADVRAVLLALHMQNDCDVSTLLVHRAEG